MIKGAISELLRIFERLNIKRNREIIENILFEGIPVSSGAARSSGCRVLWFLGLAFGTVNPVMETVGTFVSVSLFIYSRDFEGKVKLPINSSLS